MATAGSVGAVAEDNDMFARGIIFFALPETQAIYGFLIAILLLVFSGLLGTGKPLSIEAGIVAFGVGASIGFAGLGSGMGQGIAASSYVFSSINCFLGGTLSPISVVKIASSARAAI